MSKRNIFYDKYAKTKRRLFVFGIVSAFILFGSGLGVLELSNLKAISLGLDSIINDRVMPLQQLKSVSDMYCINIVDTAHKVLNGNITWAEGAKRIDETTKNISEKWDSYTKTYLVDEEKRLIVELVPLKERADMAAKKLRDILELGDRKALEELVKKQLYQSIDPVQEKISSLFHVQISIAKDIHYEGKTQYQFSRSLGIVSIALGLVLGLVLALRWGMTNRISI
ncbi:hypothetical protein PITCH_A640068 [uncultured Desulfobacterium sp.]|uniref:Chemotaxis methyl-accepting receptor HlyB-like 4HB MCP domain-containing protein n=1 Tax=uncultured Desulfobacterium sp. TaxID=201089 RepID=A0A445N1E7_9BACT|nr:hypothetical protein PITCH_A640068 [uncultured Desulfobacterium sp.]